MTADTTLLLKLLRAELWNENVAEEISSQQFHSVMREAVKQAVPGLVAQCVCDKKARIGLTAEDAVRTLITLRQTEESNRLLNSELKSLCCLFRRHAVDYKVFKGQTLARLYPHPLARTPGDIDFYVPPYHFEKARNVLHEHWNADIKESAADSLHTEFSHNGVIFEMHHEMAKFWHKDYQQKFNALVANSPATYTVIDGTEISILPPALNIAYTFAHLWYHLLELGIGMRQLCDLALLISCTFGEGSSEEARHIAGQLKEILLQLGLFDAFCAVTGVLKTYFGLGTIPFENRKPRYARPLMRRIGRYGNFGKYGRTAQRGQLKFYIALTFGRIRTFACFYPLNRKEILARATKELPSKIAEFFKH